MRILILTQYFPPESGAPQNRLSGFASLLKQKGHNPVILTAMPNYPEMEVRKEYKRKFYVKEKWEGIEVHRSWIYTSKKRNILFRLLNYFSFVFSSLYFSRKIKGELDYVLCESPPLFLGWSAIRIAKSKKAKLIFNVSDLWPESAVKLGLVSNKFFLNLAYKLEEKLYRKAFLVTGQTQGICKNINERFPSVPVHWFPNGIDSGKFDPSLKTDWKEQNGFKDNDFLILYAGILGYAQGLEVLVKSAKLLSDIPEIKFVLVGEGPEKEKLIKLSHESALSETVRFFGLVSRTEMAGVIAAANVAVIPLKKMDLFKGAIPSKIFENLAMAKPILLGVEGEAKALFVEEGKCAFAFEPENEIDLTAKIKLLFGDKKLQLKLAENGVKYVYAKFNRNKITDSLLNKLSEMEGKLANLGK